MRNHIHFAVPVISLLSFTRRLSLMPVPAVLFAALCSALCALPTVSQGAPLPRVARATSPTATRSSQAGSRQNSAQGIRLAPHSLQNVQSETPYDPDGPVGVEELDELNPSDESLRASGGLCGPLWPMSSANPAAWAAHGLAKAKVEKLEQGTRLFAKAMNQWNQGHWRPAEVLFRLILQQYPENPWAGETLLHLAEIAESDGRFGEAHAYYAQIITQTANDEQGPRYELRQKAKLRWANIDLKVGQLDTAQAKLDDLLATERHWRRRTWAQYWTVRLSQMRQDLRQARACGAESLSAVLAQIGKKQAAQRVARALPPRDDGFSMVEVAAMAKREGVAMKGFHATPEQLAKLPLPLIIHCDWEMRMPTVPALETARKRLATNERLGVPDLQIAKSLPQPLLVKGGKTPKRTGYNPAIFRPTTSGHFLVVEKVDVKNRIAYIFNDHAGLHWKYTFDQLAHEWSGTGLVIVKAPNTTVPELKPLPRLTWLSDTQMSRLKGGTWAFLSLTGKGNDPANTPIKCQCKVGAPSWSINRATCNLFLSDTPMLIHNPYGPDMALTISYNTWDSQNYATRLGPKWSLSYQSFLVAPANSSVTVYMPDGREDSWTPDNQGGYTPPSGNFSTMSRLNTTNQGFVLTFQDDSQMEYDAKNSTSPTEYYLSKVKDRYGNALTVNYIGSGTGFRINYITNATGTPVANFQYNANGKISVVTNTGSGRTCQFSYDSSNRLTGVTDMGGIKFSYTYDSNNNIKSVTNVDKGTMWSLGWEMPEANPGVPTNYPLYPKPYNPVTQAAAGPMGANLRLTLTNPDSTQAEYFFKANHNDPTYGTTAFVWYVDENHYQPYWNAQGIANTVNNSSTAVLKTRWYSVQDSQSAQARLSQTIFPVVKSNGYISEEYTYYGAGQNGNGLLHTIRQHRAYNDIGYLTAFNYNSLGNITSVIYPKETGFTQSNNMIWSYAANQIDVTSVKRTDYTASGTPTVRTIATYSNYFLHKPQDIVDGTNSGGTNGKTHIAYIQTAGVTYGKVQSITKGYTSPTDAVTTTLVYDAYGRLQTVQRGIKVLNTYTYNNRNLVTASVDGDGLEFRYELDNLDRVTKVYYPWSADPTPTDWTDHPKDQYQYCNCGELTDIINRAGQKTTYVYNNMDRLWKVYEANHATPHVTEYLYDGVGRLETVKAPGVSMPGATLVTWSYDDQNASSRKTYPDGNYEEWTSDGQGNQTSYRNARNQTANYAYDNNGRVTSVNYVAAPDVTFVHDTINLKTTMTDGVGTTVWQYDVVGRLLSEDGPWASDTVSYTYDDAGRSDTRQSQVTSTQNDIVTYGYEATLGRLTNINFAAHGGSYDYSYGYDSSGFSLLSVLTRKAGGTSLTKTQYVNRDELLRPQQISHFYENTVPPLFAQYQYTYGGSGADGVNYGLRDVVTSQILNLPTFTSAPAYNYYGYDDFDQLTRVFSGNYNLQPHQTTTYDPKGNRQSVKTDSPSTVTTAYASNDLNQYTSSSNPSATETYTYDAAGNRTDVKIGGVTQTSYITDETGALITYYSYNNGVNRYKSVFLYDGMGRLRQVQNYDWNGTAWTLQTINPTTRFVYSGGLIVQERNASNVVTSRNVWGPSMGGGIGGLLGRSTQESSVWKHFNYFYDAQGNVGQVTEAGGSAPLKASYFYDSWGQTKSTSGLTQADQPYRYSTKWTHSVSGLAYFGARWYEAGSGRFINRDPIGESGGLNLYAYVGNSPTNRVDPWGLQDTEWEVEQEERDRLEHDEFMGFVDATQGRDYGPSGGVPGGQGNMGGKGSGGVSTWFSGVVSTCRAIIGGVGGLLPGGNGQAFAGHGIETSFAGTTTVPAGTTLMIPGSTGTRLPDPMGRAIETGNWESIRSNPKWLERMEGSASYLPGAQVPNLILRPAPDLLMHQGSIRVSQETPLSELLQPNMGHMNWAACRE